MVYISIHVCHVCVLTLLVRGSHCFLHRRHPEVISETTAVTEAGRKTSACMCHYVISAQEVHT